MAVASNRAGLLTRTNSTSFVKFIVVGGIGVVVNEALLLALQDVGLYLLYASALAIELSIVSNFFMNDLWTFKDRRSGRMSRRLATFNALMIVGLVVNIAVLDLGVADLRLTAAIANLFGIGVAFILRYALSIRYAWMRTEVIEERGLSL